MVEIAAGSIDDACPGGAISCSWCRKAECGGVSCLEGLPHEPHAILCHKPIEGACNGRDKERASEASCKDEGKGSEIAAGKAEDVPDGDAPVHGRLPPGS